MNGHDCPCVDGKPDPCPKCGARTADGVCGERPRFTRSEALAACRAGEVVVDVDPAIAQLSRQLHAVARERDRLASHNRDLEALLARYSALDRELWPAMPGKHGAKR